VKLGMNMLLWSTDVCGPEFDHVFAMLKDAGYDGVEIPVFDREVEKYARLRERLEPLGLEALAVAARGAADNPVSSDPAVRAEAVAATRANLDAAAALGAPILCGPLGAPLAVFSGAAPTDEERRRAVAYLQEVAPYAEERGVTIALEYLNRFEMYVTNTASDLARLVRAVGHPRVRMMYDTYHAHIEEKDPRAAIEACADVLVHVHLSENDRSTPGTGQVAWDATFDALRAIGYDGWVGIEAFGDSLPELAGATKIWRRMFESEEQLARDGAAFVRGRLALV
jgi:D-psicose/D-tagatose/L-ribulose 3-epimerase